MRTLQHLIESKGLHIRCPSCQKAFPVKKARLFDATAPLPEHAARSLAAEREALADRRKLLSFERAELRRRSFTSTASSGVGQVLEMLTASLPALPVAAQDCRVLLKPVDYLSFVGASTGRVQAIQFIEAKTGKQRLSPVQRAIKSAVEKGAVKLRVADHQLPATTL